MADEVDVEKLWAKTSRYGGGLSSMRAGRYGMGNTRDGSGWRFAGDGVILVSLKGMDARMTRRKKRADQQWASLAVLKAFVWQSVSAGMREFQLLGEKRCA